jgi:hypothetical protein
LDAFSTYTRATWLWFGDLWEQAVLMPNLGEDPNFARITVRRWFVVRWRSRLEDYLKISTLAAKRMNAWRSAFVSKG